MTETHIAKTGETFTYGEDADGVFFSITEADGTTRPGYPIRPKGAHITAIQAAASVFADYVTHDLGTCKCC